VGAPKVSAARERILRTAHDLFYRDGIRATGIDRVIADAGVTKVTFYRHFPGKHALVRAFLERRHHEWLQAFESALADHGDRLEALPAVLATWFASPTFRGCAFINSVAELGGELPDVTDIARRHKDELVQRLARRLPSRPPAEALALASALGLAIDGAIVRATLDGDARPACQALGSVVMALLGRPPEAAGETAVPAVD
jgi:AcrR family transcriptional regulator